MELNDNKEKLREYRERAKALVAQMTLEEKVEQTLYQSPAIERLGVKKYNWWNEALHGVARAGTATVFPQAIGMAATFDEELLEKVGDAVSTEARAKFNMQQRGKDSDIYKGLTFWSPNVNIFRDPRWGRGHETFGEDPYLTSRLGVRYVQGLQGHDENYLKAAACAKHFAVHSGPESLRHEFDAVATKQDMRETYLPAFQACVQEGHVEAVMGAYNRTNGVPCCGSHELLIDILRKEWGFEGHVTSDCWAIRDFFEGHKVTSNAQESVAMAMANGCDLNCGTLFTYLVQAVQEGLVEESRIDEAVINLFTSRMKLGVFDQKEDNPYDRIPYSVVDSREMRAFNREVSTKSIVLLKNENHTLPLDKKKLKTIGVIGPNADSRKALVGNYEGTASRYVTVLEGIQDYVGDDVRVMYSMGCHLYKDRMTELAAEANDRGAEVRGICEESDVIIAVMGMDATLEGEEGDTSNEYGGGDKPDLRLPGIQHDILRIAKEYGKPVILIVLCGSATALTWEQEHLDAIVQGWYPGAQGGKAIADILFGEANPQGKLPVTFYKTTEELPDFEDYSMKGRTYRYMTQEALYPFGYGLSYTDFAYSNVAFAGTPDVKNGVEIRFTVKNTGAVDGTETVQAYIKAKRENAPNAQLKGIKKVDLKAGEEKTLTISLPSKAFQLFNEDGIAEYAAEGYEISIGGSQPDARSCALMGRSTQILEMK